MLATLFSRRPFDVNAAGRVAVSRVWTFSKRTAQYTLISDQRTVIDMATNVVLPASVNEKSSAWLEVSLLDKGGAPTIPASISFSVYDVTNGVEMVASNEITPGSTVTIHLGMTANTINAAANDYETRRVTISALFGDDDAFNDQFDYRVKNLSRI